MDFTVLWPQLFVIAIVNFLVSWLYYSPAVPWFKAWAAGVGMDISKKEMTEAEKKEMPILMGGALLSSFLISYGLQVFVHSVGVSTFLGGATLGIVAWLVFAVTQSLNTRFEGRKTQVLIINNVLYVVTYALFAGVIAVWK
jgi:UDP-N-acetylmuramyl pentapeptide phosphotransferase/UDP-N-acetylglucosamine-1-phosphate transferase